MFLHASSDSTYSTYVFTILDVIAGIRLREQISDNMIYFSAVFFARLIVF
jgi:hypothetical protein